MHVKRELTIVIFDVIIRRDVLLTTGNPLLLHAGFGVKEFCFFFQLYPTLTLLSWFVCKFCALL